MAVILCIETATRNCSVAIGREGKTIALTESAGQGYEHAEKLHVYVQQTLEKAGLTFAQLDALAVSIGPGSYTGLRIGVSAVKGLAVALGIPVIAIDTLKVLAAGCTDVSGTIVPMIDARRMEVYCAAFSADLEPGWDNQALILEAGSFDTLPGELTFIGDSNEKARTVLNEGRFRFLDTPVFPSAAFMTALADQDFNAGRFVDVAYFEPFYLKDFRVG